MSGISNNFHDSDRANQAIALLGGATAQSYNSVSLNFVPAFADLLTLDKDYTAVEPTDQWPGNVVGDSTWFSVEKQLMDSVSDTTELLPSLGLNSDDGKIQSVDINQQPSQDPELMSRYEESLGESSGGLSGLVQTGNASANSDSEATTELVGGGAIGFSLFDFIEQAVAQAQEPQDEFPEAFDGSRQGEFRELVVDTSAESVELLNGLLGTLALPIGSVALPQVGPLIAAPHEELLAYFS